MPILKAISGHTSCAGPMRYLTKGGRALAVDFRNIDAPESERERAAFDWAAVMDATRRGYGNDTPWGGMPCRTYKHYILSPDPKDGIGLDELRGLAQEWVGEAFPDFEAAIVYHDDNEGRVPHAHVIVNNTNIVTGRRLQDPHPKELNHLLQKLAAKRRLRDFDTPKAGRAQGKTSRPRAKSMQSEYLRKAEAEIASKGGYSWVADIRGRVALARAVSGSEAEFKGLLEQVGIAVAPNSSGAERRDWVYSLEGHPTWRVSGERLGLSYGKEALERRWKAGPLLVSASQERIAEIARSAYEVNDVGKLRELSQAVRWAERHHVRCMGDLLVVEKAGRNVPAAVAETLRESGVLPNRLPHGPRATAKPGKPFGDTKTPSWMSESDAPDAATQAPLPQRRRGQARDER